MTARDAVRLIGPAVLFALVVGLAWAATDAVTGEPVDWDRAFLFALGCFLGHVAGQLRGRR